MKLSTLGIVSILFVFAISLAACGARSESIPDEAASGAPVTTDIADVEAAEDPTSSTAEVSEADGTVWVANGMDDTLSVIDIATGEELARMPVGVNPHILTASPDGKLIYVINAGAHDREPGAHGEAVIEEKAGSEVTTEDDDMAGHHGAQAKDVGNSLWVINAAEGDVLARIPVGMGPTHPIASLDGTRVYVTNTDEGSVTVIDTDTWEVIATIPGLPEPHDGELTPDGAFLYLATAGDSTMTVVDTDTFESVKAFKIGQKPRGLAVGGENGEIAYVTNKGDGTLSIVDVVDEQVVATLPVGEGAHAVRVSPDGQTVYVSLSKENAVAVFDVAGQKVSGLIAVGATPEQLDLSADGRWLLVSNNGDNTLSIVDVKQGVAVQTIPVGQGAYGVQATQTEFTGQQEVASSPLHGMPRNADGYVDISVEQLAGMMSENNITLVNVHIPYQGEIPNTDLFIPFDQINEYTDELPGKNELIVLYCRSGSMSTQAAKTLAELGYTNVLEVDGGFNAWQAAGHELVLTQ